MVQIGPAVPEISRPQGGGRRRKKKEERRKKKKEERKKERKKEPVQTHNVGPILRMAGLHNYLFE